MMGTLQQRTQRKPAMVIRTEIVRVAVPARRPEATEPPESMLLPVTDPDAEPGRGRYADAY
jgi:hypothetical protein